MCFCWVQPQSFHFPSNSASWIRMCDTPWRQGSQLTRSKVSLIFLCEPAHHFRVALTVVLIPARLCWHSDAVILHLAVGWKQAWCMSIALTLRLICHMQVTALPIPTSEQSLGVTFLDSLFNFIIHGRGKQRKLGDRCAANTNTNPSNELSGAELVTSGEKFPFLPRSEIETCSLARPYPAWLLSFAPRNTISVFSKRAGGSAWP